MISHMFVSLISLLLYYRALNALRKTGLVNVVSLRELFMHLSKIYVVEDLENREFVSEEG